MDYLTEQDVAKKLQLAKTMVSASTTRAKSFGGTLDAGELLGNWLDIVAREFVFTDTHVHYGRDVTDIIMANKKFTMDRSGSSKDCAHVWSRARYTKTGTWDQQQEQWTWSAVVTLLDLFVVFLKFVTLIKSLDESVKNVVLMKRGESEMWKALAEWVELFGPLHGVKLVQALRAIARDEEVERWKSKIQLFDTGSQLIMEIRKLGNAALKEADRYSRSHPLAGHQRRY